MIKNYRIILTSLFLFSCATFSLKVNGDKRHIISTECGAIEISVKTTRFSYYRIQFKAIEGNFDLNLDSIHSFIHFSNYYTVADLSSTHSLDKKPKTLKKDEVLEITFFTKKIENFEAQLPPAGERLVYTLTLHPGNYLICNNKPVIQETIEIKK